MEVFCHSFESSRRPDVSKIDVLRPDLRKPVARLRCEVKTLRSRSGSDLPRLCLILAGRMDI